MEETKNSNCDQKLKAVDPCPCPQEPILKKCGCGQTKNPDGFCDGTHTTLIKPESKFTA